MLARPDNHAGNKSVSVIKYASGENRRPAQSGCEPGTNVPHQASVGRYRKIVLRLRATDGPR